MSDSIIGGASSEPTLLESGLRVMGLDEIFGSSKIFDVSAVFWEPAVEIASIESLCLDRSGAEQVVLETRGSF